MIVFCYGEIKAKIEKHSEVPSIIMYVPFTVLSAKGLSRVVLKQMSPFCRVDSALNCADCELSILFLGGG